MNTITVAAWVDPVHERLAFHAPKSRYVETFYGPVIGPTALLIYRNLGDRVSVLPSTSSGFEIDRDDFAARIGVKATKAHGTPAFERAIGQLAHHFIARWNEGRLEVRRSLPDLPLRLQRRLPDSLLDELRGIAKNVAVAS